MSARPQYRVIDAAPHLQIFDCVALRASLSTQSCADRWAVAQPGSSCHGCPLGRLHYGDHHPGKPPPRRKENRTMGQCARCGRRALRFVPSRLLCISCFNREREFFLGKNSKGEVPVTFEPLGEFVAAVQRDGGAFEMRFFQARHQAEVVARTVASLQPGERVVAPQRPWPTAWNRLAGCFEFQPEGGAIALERVTRGRLEYFTWTDDGADPPGSGWRIAVPRMPVMALPVEVAAEWLSGDPELTQEGGETWRATPYACSECAAGQIEVQQAPGGRWRCRCAACGSESVERAGK